MTDCPFCNLASGRIVVETNLSVSFRDGYPISKGHTLVIPRRHVASLFDLSDAERADIWTLVAEVRRQLLEDCSPDGFNVGLNDGPSAGQTVGHAHVHVIPRYRGDAEDPRGGVRWVIPEKAKYWD